MSEARPFLWPANARAAICLTYDDGMDSQLDNALPALNAYGLRGTFFVSDREGALSARRQDWAAVAAGGHELAGHTVAHPCARGLPWVKPGEALEDYDEARMKNQFNASDALITGLGAPKPETFAYTCGQTYIGEDRRSYRPLVEKHYKAARGLEDQLSDPWTEDLTLTAALNAEKLVAEELIQRADEAAQNGSWAIYMFHGVGGEHLSVSTEAHTQLLKHLATKPVQFWVTTFARATAWITEHR